MPASSHLLSLWSLLALTGALVTTAPASAESLPAPTAAVEATSRTRTERLPPEVDLWVGARPEVGVPWGAVVFRGEVGFGGRVGELGAWAVFDGGMISLLGSEFQPLIGGGAIFAYVHEGSPVDSFIGGRISVDTVPLGPAPWPPFVTVGASIGFETPSWSNKPRLRFACEPGIVLPTPTLALAVSIGIAAF